MKHYRLILAIIALVSIAAAGAYAVTDGFSGACPSCEACP
jgi:hypothetical protein